MQAWFVDVILAMFGLKYPQWLTQARNNLTFFFSDSTIYCELQENV